MKQKGVIYIKTYKIISAAITIIVVLCGVLAACRKDGGNEFQFNAEVLEIIGDSVFVGSADGEKLLLNSSEKITFSKANLDEINAETGDIVTIIYTGEIREIHPAQIDAVSWKIFRKSGASESGKLIIAFDYAKQSGSASNQFAVWIEDAGGKYIKTLYATKFTANGGYKNRSDSIPEWVKKSGLASMPKSELDVIAGATPKAGSLSYTWDLTDDKGEAVPLGEYKFFVEGSLRWKNRVLYSGIVTIGDIPAEIEATAEYFYESSDNQSALTGDSPESKMIGTVIASFIPAKN